MRDANSKTPKGPQTVDTVAPDAPEGKPDSPRFAATEPGAADARSLDTVPPEAPREALEPPGCAATGPGAAGVRTKKIVGPRTSTVKLASQWFGATRPGSADDRSMDTQEPVYPTTGSERPDPGTLRRGMKIGRYQLLRELGSGGMGAVFLARDTRLGRRVALKFLRANDPGLVALFVTEAQTTAQCNHENIVVLYEADEFRGTPYMVLEYLKGQSLEELLHQQRMSDGAETGRLLPVARAVELIVPVLRALARAHAMGIVHRDLKPANVMLTNAGVVKVLDFGVALLMDDSETLDSGRAALANDATTGQPRSAQGLAGTIPYMSPEQVRCDPLDARSDLWAVGIMLYEMVTGEHPLGRITLAKMSEVAQVDIPMPRVSEIRPDLGKLGAVIDRCLIKAVDDRIGSASALLDELHALLPDPGRTELAADESPFAGLAAFQEADAARFFGRGNDIANVVTHVRNQPIVAIAGPSGVGKSSLVRAGVIPALKRSGEGWVAVTLRPGRSPFTALPRFVELFDQSSGPTSETSTGNAGQSWIDAEAMRDPEVLRRQLREEPGRLGAELRTWALRKRRRLLVFIDQFEELYTGDADPDERAAFLACLEGLADDPSSPLRLVLAIRADFLDRMAEDRSFMSAALGGLLFLAPLSRVGLRQALEKPLEQTSYRFESPDMVDEMLAEFDATPGALPLIQFTASRLWDARDRERQLLTRDSYRDLGGVAGTLAGHADLVLAGMSGQQVELVRAVFERLVTPERTRAVVSLSEMRELCWPADAIDAVLGILANARLLVVESGGTGTSEHADGGAQQGRVEIIHESLVAGWPTLSRWLDENKDDARFLARLRSAAGSWEKSGRAEGMLWRDDIAQEARRWHEHYKRPLPDREASYLSAVFELADRSARRKRNLVLAAIAIWSLLVLAAALVYVEFRSKDRTIDEQVVELRASLAAREKALDAAEQATQRAEDARRTAVEAQRLAEEARQTAVREEAKTAAALEEKRLAYEREKTAAEAEARARVEAQRKAEDEAKARQAAEDARRAADKARAEAVKARDAEKRARLEVQALLDKEKARIKRLERKLRGGRIPTPN